MASPVAGVAAAAVPPQQPIVAVDEDPLMKEQLEDQAQRSEEIQQLRDALREHNKENAETQLVQEFEQSDRVVWKFLKARKFHIDKSAQMFKDAVAMRKEKGLDTILSQPCPKGLAYKVVSRHGWHGFDRFGRPVFLKYTGLQHFPTLCCTGTLQDRVDYTSYMGEYLRQVIFPQANARIGHKQIVDQTCTIVNLRNFGFHCIKKHNYDWVQALAGMNSLLYPESAGHCWIINAPRVFSMVWGIVKGWVDERTRNKVKIFTDNGEKELRSILGDEFYATLPKEVGGECVCMDEDSVPEHGDPCLLGHEMNRAFIAHLRQRNQEAGLDSELPSLDEEKLRKHQEEHEEVYVPEPEQEDA